MNDPRQPRVTILMGSDSDLEVMPGAARVLRAIDVEFELAVTSAHRSISTNRWAIGRAQLCH